MIHTMNQYKIKRELHFVNFQSNHIKRELSPLIFVKIKKIEEIKVPI